MYFKCTNIGVVHVFKKRRRARSCPISGQSVPWLLKFFSGLIRWRTYLSFKKNRKRFQAFLRKWEHRSSFFFTVILKFPVRDSSSPWQKWKNLKLLKVWSLASIGSLIYTILRYKISHKSYYTPPRKVRPGFPRTISLKNEHLVVKRSIDTQCLRSPVLGSLNRCPWKFFDEKVIEDWI